MNDDKQNELERQLEAERQRVRQLEEERAKLQEQNRILRSQLENYKPMAEAWLREHMPSKEECEKILTEMLAHPENLLDAEDVIRELLQELGDPESGENAA